MRAAYQQGLQEGQAAARQEQGAQLEAMQVRLARTIEELSGMRQRFRHEAEETWWRWRWRSRAGSCTGS